MKFCKCLHCFDTKSSPRFRCTVALNPVFSVAPSNLLVTAALRNGGLQSLLQPRLTGNPALPKYVCVPVADVAGRRQLRSASRGLLNFPRYNMSNYGRRAFCFAGPYVWNSLPEHNRQSTSIAVFQRLLKTFLYQQISHLAH